MLGHKAGAWIQVSEICCLLVFPSRWHALDASPHVWIGPPRPPGANGCRALASSAESAVGFLTSLRPGPHLRPRVDACWVCLGLVDIVAGSQIGAQVIGGVSLCGAGANVWAGKGTEHGNRVSQEELQLRPLSAEPLWVPQPPFPVLPPLSLEESSS